PLEKVWPPVWSIVGLPAPTEPSAKLLPAVVPAAGLPACCALLAASALSTLDPAAATPVPTSGAAPASAPKALTTLPSPAAAATVLTPFSIWFIHCSAVLGR